MNAISSWSIRNPVPVIVLFLTITLAGLVGFARLRTNTTPDIDLPTVTVTVAQPGAAPSEMETQVTRIVEDAVAGLGNIQHISSAVNEGVSVTTISFVLGTNVDRATNDVRNAVAGIQTKLPATSILPVIARLDIAGGAILTYVAEAPAMMPDELSWYIDNDISKALLSINGVSKVERIGGVERQIRVRLDPNRLMALGLTAVNISSALASVNVNMPAGRVTIGDREQTVRALGNAPTVRDLANLRVSDANGTGIRLSDLGTVADGWAEPRQRARLDGKEVVGFNVYRSVGSSEVDVTKAVRARIASLNRLQNGLSIKEVTSSTTFVTESYYAALDALWIGGLLAVGVIWLFLRDWRATLISSLALPLSLIPTFAVMWVLNTSLNNVTLLAISLVVGILVDDAIVEIENIVRHMRATGKGAFEAAMEAADEIGLAVVATTGTLVAVFLPVAFMPGIAGEFFASFAIATCVSVLFSLLVARMLTPLLSAYFIRSGGHEETAVWWLQGYLRVLAQALRFRWLTIAAGIAFFAGSLALTSLLPVDFIVAADRGRSVLSVTLPPGATLAQTDKVAMKATAILKGFPEVADVFAAIGTPTSSNKPGSSAAAEVRTATLVVNLKARSERSRSQQAIEKAAAVSLDAIPGAQIRFGADGQSGQKASVTLVSDQPDILAGVANDLTSQMGTIAGLTGPTSKANLTKPELIIVPDSAKAAELGVTAASIAATISIATIGDLDQFLPKFSFADRRISISVALAEDARNDPTTIANLPVVGLTTTVPLQSVADIRFGAGPNAIDRYDRQRSATVEATLDGLTLGQANARIAQLGIMRHLPSSVRLARSGDTEMLQELMSGFALAIGAGIVLMYFTQVLLFGGFLQPVTILVALPLSIGGALGLLLACGYPLSIFPMIGIVMLMGIAAKNSILLVEYAIVATRRGLSPHMAVAEAAAKRARPIVMTTVAMCAGMLPIALGMGADAESRAPMAIAVIGGLLTSTVLSLVYVPVVYTLMNDLQEWLSRSLGLLVNRPARAD